MRWWCKYKKLLEKSPKGKVFGIDYSEVSVRKSKKVNKFAVERKHCEILQGNVQELPFANETFDLATAFETIYFWSDIDQSFSQIYRVLKKVEFLWFVMSQMAKMTKIKNGQRL